MYVPRRANALRGLPGLDARLAGSIGVLARDRFSLIEDWHVVGEHGEPDFHRYRGWAEETQKYNSSPNRWVYWQSESHYLSGAFVRDTAGTVHLRGALQVEEWIDERSPRGAAAFTLPRGYRPIEYQEEFECAARGPYANRADGAYPIAIWGASSLDPGRVVSGLAFEPHVIWLDGIMFPADPAEIPPNVVPN